MNLIPAHQVKVGDVLILDIVKLISNIVKVATIDRIVGSDAYIIGATFPNDTIIYAYHVQTSDYVIKVN